MKTLILLGAGGFARTLADIVRQTKQFDTIIFLDDALKEGTQGSCSEYVNYIYEKNEFYPAISDNHLRQAWIDLLHEKALPIATIIHPSAYVSPTATLSDGVAILPGAIVNTGCKLDCGVLINCGAVVDHDCVVECCAHIKPNAVTKATSTVTAGSIIE